jgi:riboflavin kinase/FMN adenylyltransferase
MKIHSNLASLPSIKNAVVTSGTFDGVHLGHQKIISKVTELAKVNQGESVLITFWPHPKHVLFPETYKLKILTDFDEKSEILDSKGIDHLIKINFTREFSQLSSLEFVKNILIEKIGTKVLVIGYDHRFGKNREGSFEYLKANSSDYGFEVIEIPRQDVDHIGISSTKIRQAISEGKMEIAKQYLGRWYSLRGEVVHGNKIGKTLGYPTANISVKNQLKLIPGNGIYAVFVEYKKTLYQGMLSIGVRPTIGESLRTIEVNIFNFSETIYGASLTIHFVQKFRNEEKFRNLEELKAQLARDWNSAREILNQI